METQTWVQISNVLLQVQVIKWKEHYFSESSRPTGYTHRYKLCYFALTITSITEISEHNGIAKNKSKRGGRLSTNIQVN